VNAVPTGVKVADSHGGGGASRTWLGVKAAGHRVFVNSVAGCEGRPPQEGVLLTGTGAGTGAGGLCAGGLCGGRTREDCLDLSGVELT